MKRIHKNVYYHATRDGANVGCVVGDEGSISIDLPSTAEETLAWRDQISQVCGKPLKAVIFTSPDRVSNDAMAAMALAPGVLSIPAVIHEAGFAQLYAALEASQPRTIEPLTPAQLRERGVLPDLTFSQSMTLVVMTAGAPLFIDVTHTGGYSPGSSCVTLRDSGLLFTGETVANHEPPIIGQADLETWCEWLSSLKRNRKLTTIVPGRGPAGGPEMIADTLTYLKAARTGVQKLVKAQRPRNDVAGLVSELAALYLNQPSKGKRIAALPAPDHETIIRRIRHGLERLYDDMNQAQPAPVA